MKRAALRALYQLLEWPGVPVVAGQLSYLASRVAGPAFVDGWLSAFERRFVRSGWLGHGDQWINLHMSRFLSRVRRLVRCAPSPQPRRSGYARSPLRVGLIGRFVGLLGFPVSLFDACPPSIDLAVFDAPFRRRRADYLKALGSAYYAIELDDGATYGPKLRAAARTIADSDLDLLININAKVDAHMLLDLVDTACVANYCSGSDVLHHPRVDVEMVWQMQADYPLRNGRLCCAQTGLPVPGALVHQVGGFYDARGLGGGTISAWRDREALIVSHGSLYKFAVPQFRDCMLDLLGEVGDAHWVLMGKDNGVALESIRAGAARRGLGGRVHYKGVFSAVRNAVGDIDDTGWMALQGLLKRARLAPDPFPVGSGSARCEAYLLGAPSVHMGFNAFDGSGSLMSCDLPILNVPQATATSLAGYRALAVRCLEVESFADEVQRLQLDAATRACDPARWWLDVETTYRHWAEGPQR